MKTTVSHFDRAGAKAALIPFLGMMLALGITGQAHAYAGILSSLTGGVSGSGNWLYTGPTTISWDVSQEGNGSWGYEYTFSHPRGETSHFILEVSPTFTLNDLWCADGDFDGIQLGTWSAGGSNPNMPGSIYGLKFDDASGLSTEISFHSWRAPVWGDFYAKDGTAGGHGQNAAWNTGLTLNDTDPQDAPSDGSRLSHILRPDTQTSVTHPVPEPGSLALLGLGLAGIALVVRRKR